MADALLQKLKNSLFLRNFGLLFSGRVLGGLVSLAQSIIVARILGPEEFGLMSLIIAFPGVVLGVYSSRTSETTTKYLSESIALNNVPRALGVCTAGYVIDTGMAILAVGTCLVLADWAGTTFLHEPALAELISIYALFLLTHPLNGTSRAIFISLKEFKKLSILDATLPIIRFAAVTIPVAAGMGITGAVYGCGIGRAAQSLGMSIVGCRLAKSEIGGNPWKGRFRDVEDFRGFMSFHAHNFFNTLIGLLHKELDVLVLAYFNMPSEVGFYKIAKRIAISIGMLVYPLQSLTFPELSRLNGMGDPRRIISYTYKIALLVALPVGALSIVFDIFLLPTLIVLFYGQGYVPVIPATQIMWIGWSTWLLFFWLRPLYLSVGRIRIWTLLFALVSVTIFIISIPAAAFFGYMGMSITQCASMVVFHVLMLAAIPTMWKKTPYSNKNQGTPS